MALSVRRTGLSAGFKTGHASIRIVEEVQAQERRSKQQVKRGKGERR